MNSRRFIVILAAILALSLGACATARRTEPIAPPLRLADARLQRGEKVFAQHCHMCHPHGQGGLGPAIVNKPLPGFLMKWQIRQGLGAMPAFKSDKISPDDLDALIAYIKTVHANKPLAENLVAPKSR